MYVKKFKNGKIKLEVKKNDWYRMVDGSIKEDFYYNEMFFANFLYIETIENYYYIIDTSTSKVYNYFNSYLIQNPLKYLLEDIEKNNKVYLYPETNSEKLFEQYIIERKEEE